MTGRGPLGKWGQARNILAVRLDNLGDVVMTTPAFRAIKECVPEARLTLLASASGACALPHVPYLDDAIVYDAPWVKGSGLRTRSSDRAIIRLLSRRHFDAAILFTCYTQSVLPAALLCRLAEIPLRLGHCRENPYDLLTDWIADPEPDKRMRHEVTRQIKLVAAIG